MVTLAIAGGGPEELGILPKGSPCHGYGSPYAGLGGGIVLAKRWRGDPLKVILWKTQGWRSATVHRARAEPSHGHGLRNGLAIP